VQPEQNPAGEPARSLPGFEQGSRAMEFSKAGVALLKTSEGFRAKTYLDVNGLATIGFGHRQMHPNSFPDGVTEPLAEHILSCDVDDAEAAVERLVKVPLTQGQFDALVDFVFNLGAGRLESSTLLKDLNSGLYEAAGRQLLAWDHAAGREIAALKARREAEFALWRGSAE
jgi:lysozyme